MADLLTLLTWNFTELCPDWSQTLEGYVFLGSLRGG